MQIKEISFKTKLRTNIIFCIKNNDQVKVIVGILLQCLRRKTQLNLVSVN